MKQVIPAGASARHFKVLPVIDVSGLASVHASQRLATARELGRAAREVGFFHIVGHGIAPGLRQGLVQAAQRYFAQPLEQKMVDYIGHSLPRHRGYVPEGEEVFGDGPPDRKEAFDTGLELAADDPEVLAGTPLLGPNQWPALPGFREAVQAYYAAAFELGKRLMRGFALALGQAEDAFDPYLRRPPSQLRLIHYPWDRQAAADRPGIGAHTDYECFTLLLATSPGLEVMNDAGQWIDAPPVEDGLVVNIGDMLETLSNGHFVATSHRVRKVANERYSFPLFFACDYHTVLQPLPDFVDAGQPSRYGPVKVGEHLFAQTMRTFQYLRQRVASGQMQLPEGSQATAASFGKHTRFPGQEMDA
jgi:isopenicillin N synthase-like dioxygenase